MSRTNPTDAVSLLKEDHVRMRTLLSELASPETTSKDRRRQLLDRAERESKNHTKIEEELFYPAFARSARKSEDAQIADEAIEEHHTFDVTLAELKALSLDSPEFQPKAKVLSELAEHHMEEEEGEMFPRARVTMGATALQQLVRPMQERRKALEAEWDSLLMKPLKKVQTMVEGVMPSFLKREKVKLASAAAEPYNPAGRRADLPARRSRSMGESVVSAMDSAQKMGRSAVRTAAKATRSASRKGAKTARAVGTAARATSRTAARTASRVERTGQRTAKRLNRGATGRKAAAATRSRATTASAKASGSRKSSTSSRSRTKSPARRTGRARGRR